VREFDVQLHDFSIRNQHLGSVAENQLDKYLLDNPNSPQNISKSFVSPENQNFTGDYRVILKKDQQR
jgi:hypothetical protein